MNVKVAAAETMRLLEDEDMREGKEHSGAAHLRGMNERIQSGEVFGEKAHRWLGWMQACVYLQTDGVPLSQLKVINKLAE